MPGHSKHDLLLEAGIQLLLDSRTGDALRGLSAQAVSAAAGTSRQTFYSHWPDVEDYLMAILDDANTDVTIAQQLVPVLSGLWSDAPGRPPEDVIRETCDLDFKLWSTSDVIRIQMLFWFWSRTCPDVAERLRSYYRAADATLIPAYRRALEIWDREPVPEFDMAEIALVFSALIDGLVIRHGFDPDAVREDLFGDTILALVLAMTRHAGTSTTLAQDARVLEAADPARARAGRTKANRSVARIVRAGDRLFRTRPYEDVSVRQIAATARVTTATLYQHFRGKDEILAAVWEPRMHELRRALDEPADDRLCDRLRSHLLRLATFGHEERYLSHALIQAVAAEAVGGIRGEESIRTAIDLPGLIVPSVEQAQHDGLIADALPAYDVAATLTNNVMLRTFTRQTETPAETVDTVWTLMFDGLRPRSA